MEQRKVFTKEAVEEAVAKSLCIAEVFRNMGLKYTNYKRMKNLIKEYGISCEHFSTDHLTKQRLGNLLKPKKRDWAAPLENGKRLNTDTLRKHLIAKGVEERCSKCGLESWMDQEISLDIDHIDANSENNRFENLHFLCPNCHRLKTSKESFLRMKPRKPKPTKSGQRKTGPNLYVPRTKIDWPSIEDMKVLVWSNTLKELGLKLGVSDNAIIRHCKKHNIERPNRGTWLKGRKRPLK